MTWLLWSDLTITNPRFIIASSHNGRYEIEGPEGATREQALEKFYSALETAKIGKPEDRAALLAARGSADEQVTVTNEPVANWPRRRSALSIVFLPPFAVMVIGAGLFWAGQGFLKRQAEPPRHC